MPPENNPLQLSRRAFFTSTASGLGTAALSSLLARDTVGAATTQGPLSVRQPHHPARAKHCIFIFLAGGISQVDLFDPKPKLRQLAGQQLPQSFFEGQRFSNIKRDEALVMPGRFPFQHNGASGMELATVLPHLGARADDLTLVRSMHTDEFDHAPAEIFFNTGVNTPGRPSAGAWICYGLGSESANLPGYVVLMTGRAPVSRTSAWGSSFLPSATAGVMFRDQGESVLNLNNPAGITGPQQQAQLRAIRALNQHRFQYLRDPAIRNRIDAYEMAFRMQFAAPELNDLSTENKATHAAYGTGRPGESGSFSRNCLLARRLTEVAVAKRRIVLERFFAGGTDENDVSETGRDCFLKGEMKHRCVEDREEFLGSGESRRKEARSPASCNDDSLRDRQLEWLQDGWGESTNRFGANPKFRPM